MPWRTWTVLCGVLLAAGVAAQDPPRQEPILIPAPTQPPRPNPGDPRQPAEVDLTAMPAGALARLGSVRARTDPVAFSTVALVYAPNGKTLASADRLIRLWDPATGKETRSCPLPGGMGQASSLAFSPDGGTLAVMAYYQLTLIDVAAGKDAGSWRLNNSGSGGTVAFSPDGKTLAVLGYSNGLRQQVIALWDVPGKAEKQQIPIGPRTMSGPWAIAFAADGRTLAVAVSGQPTVLVELATGQVRDEIAVGRPTPGHYTATALAFSPDGRTLYSGSGDGDVVGWDLVAGRARHHFGTAPPQGPLHLSADGRTLAFRASDGTARLYDTTTGKLRLRLPDGPVMRYPGAVALSPDGRTVAVAETGGHLRFYDAATGRERAPESGHSGPVTGVGFAADGRTLFSLSPDRLIAWDLADKKERAARDQADERPRVRLLSPDGTRLVIVPYEGRARVVEFPSGKPVAELADSERGLHALAFAPDGQTIAASETRSFAYGPAGAREPVVHLWDVANGAKVRSLEPVSGLIGPLAFRPDGGVLAGADSMGTLRAWEVASGKVLWQTRGTPPGAGPVMYPGGYPVLRFAPDGRLLAAAAHNGPIRLFDATNGAAGAVLEGHAGTVQAVAFAPDGATLASGGADRLIRVWDVTAATPLHRLTGHFAAVDALAYSADGKLLASGSADSSVLLWDATKLGRPDPAAEAAAGLTAEQLAKAWTDLASQDAKVAFRAVQTLAAAPRASVPRLRELLPPAGPVDEARLTPLLVELDADDPQRRMKATEAIAALGEGARAGLRKHLATATSAEVRLRLAELIQRLDRPGLSVGPLRQMRAIEALERAGTPEARALLDDLAKGLPAASLTREAKAALERMGGS